MTSATAGKIAVNAMRGRLVVAMPARLSAQILQDVCDAVLERLGSMPVQCIIFDMSTVGSMDSREFGSLAQTARMVNLMGWPAVFSGMQPGVVSSLMDLDVDINGITAVRSVDDALAMYEAMDDTEPESEPDSEEAGPDDEIAPEGVRDVIGR